MSKELEIKEYLLDNMDELREIVVSLNAWNGCLESLSMYQNDESFFETMFADKPYEAVRAWHFGECSWNDEYIRFNGYGNLETLSDSEFEQEMRDYIEEIVENLIEYQNRVSVSDELEEILNKEDEDEESDEEDEEEDED